jgi:ribosome modulation factor
VDYKAGIAGGFKDGARYAEAKAGGFTDADTYERATAAGYSTAVDYKAGIAGGFKDAAHYAEAKAGGFTNAENYSANKPILDLFQNYDFEKDIVAQVLNYSTFAAEGVTGHSVSQFEAILSFGTPGAYRKYITKPGRYTWRKDEKDSCVYHLAVSGEKPEDSSMSVAKIDLNSYSPKLIKFENEYYRERWWTLVKHEIDILFSVTKGSIDSDRLIRG